MDPLRTQGIHGDGQGHRRVDTPGQTEHNAREAVFIDVIPDPQHQCLPDSRNIGIGFRNPAGHNAWLTCSAPLTVQPAQGLLKFRSGNSDGAVRMGGKGGAIENQFILTTHLINVDHWKPVITRALGHQLLPLCTLAPVKRRCIQVNQ